MKYNIDKNTFKFIYEIIILNKKLIIYTGIISIIGTGISLISPYIAKLQIDQLVSKNTNLFNILYGSAYGIFVYIILLGIILEIIQYIKQSISLIIERKSNQSIDKYFLQKISERLQNIYLGEYLNIGNKKILKTILNYNKIIKRTIDMAIDSISFLITIIGIFYIIGLINIKYLIIIIISSTIIYFINKYTLEIGNKFGINDRPLQMKLGRINNIIENSFSKISSIGGQKFILKSLNDITIEQQNLYNKNATISGILEHIGRLTNSFSKNIITLLVAYLIIKHNFSIGMLTLTISYVSQLEGIINRTIYYKNEIRNMIYDLKIFTLFLDMTKEQPNKKKYPSHIDTIQIKGIKFAYPSANNFEKEYLNILKLKSGEKAIDNYTDSGEQNPMILNGIDLQINKGETIGIVGRNGAGKTTLINLIMDYFYQYQGEILINGINSHNISKDFFLNNIGHLGQDPFLVDGFSVYENLTLGCQTPPSQEKIDFYLKRYGLDKVINELPSGINTQIGYETNFSGGQSQLICFIRLLLQNRPILIIDEGTSQLDAENEHQIMSDLLSLRNEKIIIFITHKMTTIQKADKIYCIDKGKIQDQGTHFELLKKENIYTYFRNKQVHNK